MTGRARRPEAPSDGARGGDPGRRTGRRPRSSSSRRTRRRSAAPASPPATACSRSGADPASSFAPLPIGEPVSSASTRRHALVELARARVPEADLSVGDLQHLPYEDDAFDVVAGFNAFFFADDMVAALREAGRVAKPGSPVVIQVWGAHGRCSLDAIKPLVRPFFPGYDPDAPPPPTSPPRARSRASRPRRASRRPTRSTSRGRTSTRTTRRCCVGCSRPAAW